MLLAFILLSCAADNSSEAEKQETFSISNSETVEFLLSKAIPIEGGYSISKQAERYSVSEIQYKENGIFYVYAPEEGFTGTDIVEIKREDSNGAEVYSVTKTKLTIKVTD